MVRFILLIGSLSDCQMQWIARRRKRREGKRGRKGKETAGSLQFSSDCGYPSASQKTSHLYISSMQPGPRVLSFQIIGWLKRSISLSSADPSPICFLSNTASIHCFSSSRALECRRPSVHAWSQSGSTSCSSHACFLILAPPPGHRG